MKIQIKLNLVFLAVFGISIITTGQIKVFENNYVSINYSSTPSSRFVINSAGNSAYQAYIYGPNIFISGGALAVLSEKGSGSGIHIRALTATTNIGSGNYLYGIKATAYSSTAYTTGRTYGIFGQAGNATSGYNYAVYGYLAGTRYGAAIFGAINGKGDVGLTAQFAGYFRGNLKCENTIYAVSFQTTSDEKYKTNITEIDPSEALTNISRISPKKYNLKQYEIVQQTGDTIAVSKYYDESDQLFKKVKYGVIAQDLQKIYPDLVYEDNEGNLSVDYNGLIPIMIKAIQSQQNKIEELDALLKKMNKTPAGSQ